MKRFITYLYECERGNKTKNIGFVRVNVRGEKTTIEVYIRNMSHGSDVGKIYALAYETDLHGIELGEIKIESGQNDSYFELQTDDVMQSAFSINSIEGIGIQLDSGVYIASCWKDTFADKIARGEFKKEISSIDDVYIEESEPEEEIEGALAAAEDTMPREVCDRYEETRQERCIIYEKIDLSQIRDLPSPNWHLATNSFLVHGVWNYGYLVLKKDMAEDKETLSLGVPGIFERPEAVMAVFFGFPTFEEIPEEVVGAELNQPTSISEIKENQESKTGAVGCWFVKLQI